MIKCQICNQEFQSMITSTHLKSHDMTTKQYKDLYGKDSVSSPEFRRRQSERNSGANNPNYNNKWTEEQKAQMSDQMKGNVPWNKGVKFQDTSVQQAVVAKRELRYLSGELVRAKTVISDELKLHLSSKTKEYATANPDKIKERSIKASNTRKERKLPGSMKGKTHSVETKKKLSDISSARTALIKEETINQRKQLLLEHNITFISHSDYRKYSLRCNICNYEFSCSISYYIKSIKTKRICPICNPRNYSNTTSKGEQEVYEYVKTLSANAINNDRVLLKPPTGGKSKEIDILLPDLKIAIEYNGIYWHSRKLFESLGKSNTSDNEKRLLIESFGYTSIQINECDWESKKKSISRYLKSVISNSATEYKCNYEYKISKLTIKNAESLFNRYSLRGSTEFDVAYGIKVKNKIVAAMSFKRDNNISWQLCNYIALDTECELYFLKILMDYFITTHRPDTINYRMDNCYPTNKLLTNIGMHKVGETDPDYWLYKGKQDRIHYSELVKPVEYKNMTDIEYFELQGYMALYDNGMSLWQWEQLK